MKKGVRTRKELRATLVKKIGEEYSDADLVAEANVFKALGVMDPKINYKKLMLDLLTEQIAGFYDQDSKELYIMEGLPVALQRPTMAHEIFHVIQDQHFDILAMQAPFNNKEHSDFQLARSALLEGDATVLMLDFSLYEAGSLPQKNTKSIVESPAMVMAIKQMSQSKLGALESVLSKSGSSSAKASALQRAPRFIRELLMFPYLGGLRFVIEARQGRTWKQFDAIYKNPPVSTEQILHPERYFAKDDPILLNYTPNIAGATKIYDNVFGEMQMLLMLKSQLIDNLPNQAKPISVDLDETLKGWDGDRIMAYRTKDGRQITIHLSVWDSPKDASEYYAASLKAIKRLRTPAPNAKTQMTQKSIASKYGQATCVDYANDTSKKDAPKSSAYLEQWGDMVLFIDGLPSAQPTDKPNATPTAKVRDAIWKSLKRVPFRAELNKRIAAYKAKQKKP